MSGLKLAFFDDDGVATPTKEIVAAVRDSAKAFTDAGVKVEEKRPPDAEKAATVYHDMSRGDGGAGTRAFLKSIGSDPISPLFEKALTYWLRRRWPTPPKRWQRSCAGTCSATRCFASWRITTRCFRRWRHIRRSLHGTSFDEDSRKGFGYAQMY